MPARARYVDSPGTSSSSSHRFGVAGDHSSGESIFTCVCSTSVARWAIGSAGNSTGMRRSPRTSAPFAPSWRAATLLRRWIFMSIVAVEPVSVVFISG